VGKRTIEPPNDEEDDCVRNAEVKLFVHGMQDESAPRQCVRARFSREIALKERICTELMMSDRQLEASREGSKRRIYGTSKTLRYTM